MGKHNVVPDRWSDYKPMGTTIPGTSFMACKVPLKPELQMKVPVGERFGVAELLDAYPNIGMVIDLTNTDRYYSRQDFLRRSVRYEKIYCVGRILPPTSVYNQFASFVDSFLRKKKDTDSLIAVHCTHGINRTGYFICRYMIEKLKMTPEEAIKNFEQARGYPIERDIYLDDLKNGCQGGSESLYKKGKVNWREMKKEKRAARAEEIKNGVRNPEPKQRKEKQVNGRVKGPPVNLQRRDPNRYNFRMRDRSLCGPRGPFGDGIVGEQQSIFIQDNSRPIDQREPWIREERMSHFEGNPRENYGSKQQWPSSQHFGSAYPRLAFNFQTQHQPPNMRPGRNGVSPQFQRSTNDGPHSNWREPEPTNDGSHSNWRVPEPLPVPSFPRDSVDKSQPGSLIKVYSPQNRFPAPFTCNPRPNSFQPQRRYYRGKAPRWMRPDIPGRHD